MAGFQQTVNRYQAPAQAGDWTDDNPRVFINAGNEDGLLAGEPVNVAKFFWRDTAGHLAYSHGTHPQAPAGFVHRDFAALFNFQDGAGNVIPAGRPVAGIEKGGLWALNTGPSESAIDGQVYATYATGDAATAAVASASATASIGATMTASIGATFTATGTSTALVVTSLTGLISIGDEISGTGVPAGTTIVAQVSGTAGVAGTYTTSEATTADAATVTAFGSVLKVTARTGYIAIGDAMSAPAGAVIDSQVSGTAGDTGVYTLSIPADAYTASGTLTCFGDTLTVSVVGSGTLDIGEPITGSGVPSGAVLAAFIDGTNGGAGHYTISPAATAYAASTTIAAVGGIAATGWVFESIAAMGELAMIARR